MVSDCIHETTGKRGRECVCLTKMLCRTGECSFYKSKKKYLFNKEKDAEGRIVGVEAIYEVPAYRPALKIQRAGTANAQMKEWSEKYKDATEFKDFFLKEWPKTCAIVKEALANTGE